MRMRGLLIASLVLIALGGGLWWSNKVEEEKAKNPAADAPPKILTIPGDQIRKIEIRKAGGEALTLEKSGTEWSITAPTPLKADQGEVGSLLSTLVDLASDRLVEEKAPDLAQFGLKDPLIVLAVTTKAGKTEEILLGDEAPTGGSYYTAVKGAPRLYTVSSYVKNAIDKTPNDFRDKRLLPFDSEKLTRVELSAQGQTIEFGKNNQNEWQILKPRPLRADGGQVETLVQRLREARMEPPVSDEEAKKTAAAFAAAAPVAAAKVSDAAGEQQLQIRKDKDQNYYARSTAIEGVYRVAAEAGEAFNKGLDDFRNKKVFDFGWSDPSKIEARDGAKQTVYSKSGDKWTSAGKTMDSAAVQNLVDKLRDLSATAFPEKGFAEPTLEFTVTSNGGKRVEKAALAKAGADWIAKRENEPTLYQLDAKVVEELQKALGGVKESAPQSKKK